MGRFFRSIKRAASDFSEDDCMSSGAAIAYYTIFSLPPLLGIVYFVAQYFGVPDQEIQRVVSEQTGIPAQAMGQMQGQGAQEVGNFGMISRIIGVALLIFSATGVFGQLQYSLNRAWEVEPDPKQSGVWAFITKRFLSLGMIVVIGFLLLVSLVMTTLIDEILSYVQGGPPEGAMIAVGIVINNLAAFAVATLLFAAMFKLLPDVKMSWRDIWMGAGFTALMFVIGKALLGWYLNRGEMAGGWGEAAGSLIAVLVWVYYSSLIVLFGAELTQVWSNRYGQGIEPAEGAVRKIEKKEYVPAK